MGKQMIFNYINILGNALRNGIIGLLGSPSLNQAAEEIYTRVHVFIRIHAACTQKVGVWKLDDTTCS